MYRGNYLHSPKTWAKLWTDVFTELESAKFADEHVRIQAEFLDSYAKGKFMGGMQQDMPEMWWSVNLV